MKRFFLGLSMASAIFTLTLVGCASPLSATPSQTAINATYASYASLDQAILAADAAVKSGALKGQDARNALSGMTTAKIALDATLSALKAATPASGATK